MSNDIRPAKSNREIFLAALDIANAAERQAFLERACDAAQRRVVERLLDARGRGTARVLERAVAQFVPTDKTDFIHTQGPEADDSIDFDISSHPTIDRYKLLEQIGEGGMGTVFMAQQNEPIRRRVALKLIKPGMDSREVISRFQAERQALAMMDHPNIAHVLDAGATAEGRPYFVMELVRGTLITDHCDANQLSIDDRLRLLVDVCRAVQHAHQKGIIHRDLKPSNVMVALHDGTPVVKVIDFGVAKALNQELTERTLFTQFSQLIGTPLYMSPEQAEMSGLDVDTRSDVYSLGVLLYELLTGATPFDKQAFSKAGFDGMRRIICEEEPPRPSHKISTLEAPLLSTVSSQRNIDGRQLASSLHRELDWIALKALEKDRNRRYQSASSLAADLERYLANEPVQACPPSVLYRLRKLTRRHQGILTAAGLAIALMLIGLIVSSRLAFRASRAEHAARDAQWDAEQTTEEMRNLLYASDVMLASQDWQHNDVQQARKRLARHIPTPGQRDLRGFEWHYLWKQQDVAGVEIANLGSAVYDIAISPDGNLFAATGAGAVIHCFDTLSGAPRLTIATHQVETNGIAFSPDSSRIAATGDDGTLRVWDLDTRRELWSTEAHKSLAYQVKYSPDGNTLVTCGKDDERVRLWDASSGASLGAINEHQFGIESIDMSASGLVAAGDRQSQTTLWNLQKKVPVWTAGDEDPDPVCAVVFSDSRYFAHANNSGQLTITDIRRGAVVSQRRFADGIQSLAFASHESWLTIGDRAGHLRIVPFERGVWDLRSAREWPAHDGRVYAVKVTPDGKRILSGGADGRIMAWEPQAGTPDRVVQLSSQHTTIKSLHDDRFLIGGQSRVMLCDRDGTVLQKIGPPNHWRIAVALSAHLVFGASLTEEIRAWNIDTGKQVFYWPPQDQADNVAIAATPDGRTVCLVARFTTGFRQLQIIDVGSGSLVAQLPVRSANHLDISPDGRWLGFDSDNDIQLYDLENRAIAGTWQGHQGSIRGLQFSHDGSRVGSVSADRTLKLWSVPTGEMQHSVIAHRAGVVDLEFSPDGKRIATTGKDRMLRIWDGQRSEPLWEYPVATDMIQDFCFSGDGQRLLSLSNYQHVLILDGSPIQDRP